MDVKEMVFKLTGVKIVTDDFLELRKDPEKYTETKEDTKKIRDLLTLLSDSEKLQRALEGK